MNVESVGPGEYGESVVVDMESVDPSYCGECGSK